MELRRLRENPSISNKILFSVEANFYVNEEVNRQSLRHWSYGNPLWMSPTKVEGGGRVKVWAGVWGDRIIGHIFVDGNPNADKYLIMLQE